MILSGRNPETLYLIPNPGENQDDETQPKQEESRIKRPCQADNVQD